MKKTLKISVIVLVGAIVILQLFQIDKTNPPINEADTLEAAVSVPPDISLILGRSCNDCHSHKTIYPWYSNIQPVGWFLRDHIDHGRSHLNFSVFNTYSRNKKVKAFDEICEMVESATMPLESYLWLHRDAVLARSEAEALCAWAKVEQGKLGSEIGNRRRAVVVICKRIQICFVQAAEHKTTQIRSSAALVG